MRFLSKQKLFTILITGIIIIGISGCNEKEKNNYVSVQNSTPIVLTSNNALKVSNENRNIVKNETINKNKVNKEDEIIQYFKNLKNDVSKYINDKNIDKVKNKINDAFFTTIDFIFYDKKINGVTFNSLSNTTKKQILETANDINNIIIKKYPNYQVIITDRTIKVKDFIKEKANFTKDVIKDKIGKEKYNDIKDNYEQIKDKTIEIKNKSFSKIKTWYEQKRGNN